MPDPIIKVNNNGTNKIVTINGQILQAPVGTGDLQDNKAYTVQQAGTLEITPDTGYTGMRKATLTVPNGVVKPANVITGSNANISSQGTTISLDSTISNTPTVTVPGYVSEGTAGNTGVLLSATDANFIPGNIKKNITIFGKTGTYEGSSGGGTSQESKSYTVQQSGSQTILPDSGYDSMDQVALNVPAGNCSCPSSILVENVNIANLYGTAGIQTNVSLTPVVNAGYISTGTSNTPLLTIYTNSPYHDTSPLTIQDSTLIAPAGFYPQAYSYTLSGTGVKKEISETRSRTLSISGLSSRPSYVIGMLGGSGATPDDIICFYLIDAEDEIYVRGTSTIMLRGSKLDCTWTSSSGTYTITLVDTSTSTYFASGTWQIGCF